MPFISSRVNMPMTPQQKETVKTELGQIIGPILTKGNQKQSLLPKLPGIFVHNRIVSGHGEEKDNIPLFHLL